VRQQDERRLHGVDDRAMRGDPAVGGVPGKSGRGDRHDLGDVGRRDLGRRPCHVAAGDGNGDRLASREVLRSGDGFPRGAVERAIPLLGDDEDHAITLASSRSLRTSVEAASTADPVMISVCLVFCGT
jgi:hypothetical protein